jgi:hypothetical protein
MLLLFSIAVTCGAEMDRLNTCKVIDLQSIRLKKQLEESVARGRTPLYESYKTAQGQNDFPSRMQRIRESLEKINMLMAQIKKEEVKH